MDKQPSVVFRNVGQLYFPQIRVECHYSLSAGHRWSSSDWIGIFQLGWSSLKEYYTYTWALVPEGYKSGISVDSCALFYACYLPRPGATEYQFVYVNKTGKVCARSRPFIFCAPKPLEELETLREDGGGEEGADELLLVVPRAQLLQTRLEECLQTQAGLQRALDTARREAEAEREAGQTARRQWESEREETEREMSELRDKLRHSGEMLRRTEGKQKDAQCGQENLTSELTRLTEESAEKQQHIKDLEDKVAELTEREAAGCSELDRLRERVKKTSAQMKHDEEKRAFLQAQLDASAAEAHGLQERLDAGERLVESLRREQRELSARQNQGHAELHQARLQAAQLTLRLSEEELMLREERATCALEREAHRHATEVEKSKVQELSSDLRRTEQWLQEERTERENLEAELQRERAVLSEVRRELQDTRAGLRRVQKEREDEQLNKQELLTYIHQLELRLGIECETDRPGLGHLGAKRFEDDVSEREESEDGSEGEVASSEPKAEEKQTCEEKQLLLPELLNPILSELADAPMW